MLRLIEGTCQGAFRRHRPPFSYCFAHLILIRLWLLSSITLSAHPLRYCLRSQPLHTYRANSSGRRLPLYRRPRTYIDACHLSV